MFLSYLIKRVRRHPSEAIVSTAIVLVIVIFLIGLHMAKTDILTEMDRVYDTMEIRCRVTSADGSREISLPITEEYVHMVMAQDGILYPYVKDVFLLETYSTAEVGLPPESKLGLGNISVALHMTNNPEQYTPKQGAEIKYMDGYSAADFAGTEPVCVISHKLEDTIAEDGTVKVYVVRSGVSMNMKVIGIYADEENTVFGAWQPLIDLIATVNWTPNVSSMSFTVADNRQLDLTKTLLRDYYVPASKLNNDSVQLGLVVEDSLFVDTMTVLERSMSLLGVVQVIVYVLSLGISFLVAYLNIRARRLEFAVMRSLSTRRVALYSEVLCEYILFSLLGVLLAVGVMSILGAVPDMAQFRTIGQFVLCYLLGVAVAVAQVTSGKIMQTLKGKE